VISQGDIVASAIWVATYEGPYHCDPNDPGGATAFGLSIRYTKFTDAQLRAITVADAAQYYVQNYAPKNYSLLPQYFATPLLAFAILETSQAVIALQRSLGVPQDGVIGNQTAAAAAREAPKLALLNYYRECMRHLRTRPEWPEEGLGWECRQVAASLEAIVISP
jgi:lysozyme family protein